MKQTKQWTTKDGRKLRICDMGDGHLISTIAMLQRAAEAKRIYNSVYYATCTGPTGDMASLAFDQECEGIWDSEWEDWVPDIHGNLVADAERRGLEIPHLQSRIDVEVKLIGELMGAKK